MYVVNLEHLPGGDLSKKKTIGTLHMIPVGDSSYRYRLYDENKKVVLQDQINDLPKTILPWQIVRMILAKG